MKSVFAAYNVLLLSLVFACSSAQEEIRTPANEMQGPNEMARLLEQAGSEDVAERIAAIQALENVDSASYAPQFIGALESESPSVRQLACKKLKDSGSADAGPKLTHIVLNDDNASVRRSCVVALGRLGDASALDPLVRVARNDPNESVRKFAVVALGSLGLGEAAIPLGQLLVGPQPEHSTIVREAAMRALAKLRDTRGVEPLIVTFHSQPWPAVVKALAAIGNAEADAFLRNTFVDPEAGEGRLAIPSLLLERGDGAHDDFLLEQARSGEHASTRALVYRAARESDIPETRRRPFGKLALEIGAKDPSPEVRKEASELLEWIK